MKTPSKLTVRFVSAMLGMAFAFSQLAAAAPQEESSDKALTFSLDSHYSYAGKTTLERGNKAVGSMAMSHSTIALGTSLFDTMSLGLEYGEHDFHSDGVQNSALPDRLRSLSMNFGYKLTIDDSSAALLLLNPGFHTAGRTRTFNHEGFGFTGIALYHRKHNEAFAYSLGVAYDSLATGTLHVFPVLGLEWTPSENWTFSLGIPETSISYKLSESLKLALRAEGTGGTYYLEKDIYANDGTRPSLADSMLEFYDIRTGLALTWTLPRGGSIELSAGSLSARQFDFDARKYKIKSRGSSGYVSLSCNLSF